MKRSRPSSPTPPSPIFLSPPIHESTSTFIGAFSPSLTPQTLQNQPKFRTATHKIAAWRKPSRQKSLTPHSEVLFDEGHDDDGESWAGKRLSAVMRDTQTEGVVVVARWYGGHNIGPVRFAHIERCAQVAIATWRQSVAGAGAGAGKQDAVGTAAGKRVKSEDEVQRRDLVKNLQERDYNIFALRKLLAQKKKRLLGNDDGFDSGEKAKEVERKEKKEEKLSPRKIQAYENMGLDALRRMDKARDATIAFVLKQIDTVDEELKLVVESEAVVGETAERREMGEKDMKEEVVDLKTLK